MEGQQESAYRWESDSLPIEIHFRAGGESYLPTALASMTAKYLRELSMKAWNKYWCDQVKGLRPTAGYPADAKRFKREIEPLQNQLEIPDHILWRKR